MEASTSTPTAADVARRDFEALANRDLDTMVDCYADHAVIDSIPAGIFRGKDGARRMLGELFAGVPDSEATWELVVADERTAVAEWRVRGTFSGAPIQGVDATGRAIELRGVDVMTVEDGKIVRNDVYYDGLELARQIGLMPPAESGAEKAMKGAFNAATKLRSRFAQR